MDVQRPAMDTWQARDGLLAGGLWTFDRRAMDGLLMGMDAVFAGNGG